MRGVQMPRARFCAHDGELPEIPANGHRRLSPSFVPLHACRTAARRTSKQESKHE
jgi:hypothetical protein